MLGTKKHIPRCHPNKSLMLSPLRVLKYAVRYNGRPPSEPTLKNFGPPSKVHSSNARCRLSTVRGSL